MNSENNSKKKTKKKSVLKNRLINNFSYAFIKITGAIPTLLALRPKVIYKTKKPNTRGGLLISVNHVGMIDPIIVLAIFKWRNPHFLATDNLYRNKISATFFGLLYCIKTNRDNFSIAAFHTVVERLENGYAIVIFPEGQINRTEQGGVLPFKSGVSLMAYKSGAPVLPVYIVKRSKWYQRQRVVIGEPIDVRALVGDKPSIDRINSISDVLQQKELELRDYYEENFNKKKTKNKNSEVM